MWGTNNTIMRNINQSQSIAKATEKLNEFIKFLDVLKVTLCIDATTTKEQRVKLGFWS